MLHGSSPAGIAGSELTRLLAHLAGTPPPQAGPDFAERLGDWLSWTGAIALSAALNAEAPSAAVHAAPRLAASPDREDGEVLSGAFVRLRAGLEASIAAGPREGVSGPAEFAPFRRHVLARQQAMQDGVQPLRQRLRLALSRGSDAQARLAAVDAVMDQGLAAQERALLGLVPVRLQLRFEQLQQAGAASPTAWLDSFRKEVAALLRAELAHRLLPAQGLLAALQPDGDR